jgi:hypothetical protein
MGKFKTTDYFQAFAPDPAKLPDVLRRMHEALHIPLPAPDVLRGVREMNARRGAVLGALLRGRGYAMPVHPYARSQARAREYASRLAKMVLMVWRALLTNFADYDVHRIVAPEMEQVLFVVAEALQGGLTVMHAKDGAVKVLPVMEEALLLPDPGTIQGVVPRGMSFKKGPWTLTTLTTAVTAIVNAGHRESFALPKDGLS